MKVAINGADRPTTNDMLEQLIEVITHPFDFCKKVSVNMELKWLCTRCTINHTVSSSGLHGWSAVKLGYPNSPSDNLSTVVSLNRRVRIVRSFDFS